MLGLLFIAVPVSAAAAVAVTRCYEPQVLGTWRLRVSGYDFRPEAGTDRIVCPPSIEASQSLLIRLEQGGILIDEATGASGTWSMGGTQALEAHLLGYTYMFNFAYEENATHTISHCWRSEPGRGWASSERVLPEAIACISAELLEAESPNLETILPKNESFLHTESDFRAQPVVTSVGSVGSDDAIKTNFSWADVDGTSFLPPTQSQGACNSSFAISALRAMMSRVMIQTNRTSPIGVTQFFSLQHVLDCNFYSQGCEGGLPEHVIRFAREHGVLVEEDYYISYVSSDDGEAHACQVKKGSGPNNQRYFFTAGQPLGGHSGAVFDPIEIQREVQNHGPIPIGVDLTDGYDNDTLGGDHLFTGEKYSTYNEANHYVLLVGWGTENGTDYWVVQDPRDSQGNFRKVPRGQNRYGIESAPTVLYWVKESPKNPPRRLTVRKVYVLLLFIGSIILAALALALIIAILVVRFRRPKFRPIVA
ncbi:Dipeptidyl-peptidase I [Giardia muris]|uniref:Dipeptidyl-peptidase I n=1 Tax=Giardia muris TaxID=5742 RepID=A0A4Z1T850_GIAMU|nr:Dipeptidyl-peptidase I [Giardia muris]|eukprot:TNJ29347.1 Dipeptidyl-peptidase I [Giardia muris]